MPRLTSQQLKAEGSPDFYYAPGKIVIQLTKEVSPIIPLKVYGIIQTGIPQVDKLCQRFKVHTMRRQFPAPKYATPDLTRHFVVRFDESMNLDEVVDAFSKIPFVEKVDKVGVHNYLIDPSDEDFNKQWYLNQTNDCDIDAPEAWNIQAGSDSVILAIADSGVAYNHSDLNGNVWINWTEYYGTPDVDDDGNERVDDIYGWDFDEDDEIPTDYYGHGTHCSGIAAAETNNDIGVAGISGGWYPGQEGCRIMCLCIGHWDPDMSCAASAITYATDMGATAINCSWWNSNTGGLGDAVDYAVQNGVLIVVSAGNDNEDNPTYLGTREDCLDVGATNIWDEKASYSNHGDWVDVAAPGGEGLGTGQIYSTLPDGYGWKKGTSMAAPMVVGLAGLLKSERPDWGRVKIWDAIVASGDYIGEPSLGSGRINAHYALKQTLGPPAAPSNLAGYGYCFDVIIEWEDNSDNESGFKIERRTFGTNFVEIGRARKNSCIYADSGLMCDGPIYFYRVRAYNGCGDSPYSNVASAKTTRCRWCGFLSLEITPDKEIINSGESVTYIYEVENKEKVDLTDVELIDDKFGKIAAKFTLKKGETKTFTKTVALTENTTNSAEATAIYHYENKTEIVKSHANAVVEVRK